MCDVSCLKTSKCNVWWLIIMCMETVGWNKCKLIFSINYAYWKIEEKPQSFPWRFFVPTKTVLSTKTCAHINVCLWQEVCGRMRMCYCHNQIFKTLWNFFLSIAHIDSLQMENVRHHTWLAIHIIAQLFVWTEPIYLFIVCCIMVNAFVCKKTTMCHKCKLTLIDVFSLFIWITAFNSLVFHSIWLLHVIFKKKHFKQPSGSMYIVQLYMQNNCWQINAYAISTFTADIFFLTFCLNANTTCTQHGQHFELNYMKRKFIPN